jgi:ABC-2 type transport system permease protein
MSVDPSLSARAAASHGTPVASASVTGWALTTAIIRRGFIVLPRIPSALIPALAMPLFITIAFTGTFGDLANLPVYPTDNFANWVGPWAILQGAAFAAVGASFGVARDLENGFYDRMLVAPAPRASLAFSPAVYAGTRALIPLVLVLAVVYLFGGSLQSLAGLVAVTIAAIGVGAAAALWGLGIFYRFKTQRAGALVQIGIFTCMFLTTGQAPIDFMEGWLPYAARVNPMTYVLTMARQGFLDTGVSWADTWPGLVALAAALLLLGWFCWRGFKKLIP